MNHPQHDTDRRHGSTHWPRFTLIVIPAVLVALLLTGLILSGVIPRLDTP